jgi:hypothetical protein
MTDTTGMTDADVLEILQSARNPRERRATQAFELIHATRFTDDPLFKSPVHLVEQLMSIPQLYDPLRRATTDPAELEREERGKASRAGRPRKKGDIAPVMLAWVLDRQPEMQHFHDYEANSKVWKLAGFEEVPGNVTWWNRIVEAEVEHIPAWESANRYCWSIVRQYVPGACRNWRMDGTPYETHVTLDHACKDPDACAAAGGASMPKRIQRAGIEDINEERHAAQKAPPPEEEAEPLPSESGDLTREKLLAELQERIAGWDDDLEEVALEETYPEPVIPKHRRRRRPKQPGEKLCKEIFIGNKQEDEEDVYKHRYECRDPDSGFRIYEKGTRKIRQWVGGIAITISDDTTEAQIGQLHIPADVNESTAFLDALALGVRMTGCLPENVIVDRGMNTRRNRQTCALLRIGMIAPWRSPQPTITKRYEMRRDTHDEYGIPTCRYCGGSGTTVGKNLGFEFRRGKPVITYRCASPVTQECYRRKQRRPCSLEWLLLGVISREDPLYYELRNQGKPSERMHGNARKRSGQSGNNLTSRPKRIGIPFMALRAAIGAFLDVFRLCLRFGWLGSHPKVRPALVRPRTGGKEAVERLQKRRQKFGLFLPRGKVAQKLRLVFEGVLPDGYKPVAQRRKEKREAAKKAAAEKKAKLKAEQKAAAKADAAKAAAAKDAAGEEANAPPEASAA